ncbi:MAG: DUF2892 domain-containing protein [Ignavibacteriae bacterium]|nr:DUF2892 domain-containing protein [Ignavibacteriota bacterium]
MEKNVGGNDKNIRLIIGAILLIASFLASSFWLGLIGVILITTALVGFCPAYIPLKKNTFKSEK